tara:strand:+ start:23031 stop:23549 length:519 start_codon:yes stop_codon:yes gene_type:complete
MTFPQTIVVRSIPRILAFGIALVFVASSAHAGKSKIDKTFRGQIIISDDALPAPDGADEKGTIKSYKALRKTVIESTEVDGVASWNFNFTAFAKTKPKTASLTLEFYTDDKEKLFVADKRLNGADPNLMIVASSVRISEDENVNKGRKYILKLVAKQGKKDVILATTKISTK